MLSGGRSANAAHRAGPYRGDCFHGVGAGWAGEAVYAASKGATAALVRGMAVDLAPFGIVVNAVGPGSIDTPGVSSEVRENADVVQHDLDRTPLGRWGKPEEIAAVVRFLADATFMTGRTIYVDGGFRSSGAAFYGRRREALLQGFGG